MARSGAKDDTAAKWRPWSREYWIDGLVDEPRIGRPASVTVEQVDYMVATLEQHPVERHALLDGEGGRAQWAVAVLDRPDLEDIRTQTPPRRRVEALQ